GGLLIEEPLALGTGCNRGFGFKAFAAEIDRRRRVGNQVVVPVRIARTTGVGCDEHDAIAVTRVDQRRRVSPSRASALGCEEQQRSAGELTSDFAVVGFELLDDLAIEFLHIHPISPASWCGSLLCEYLVEE